MHLLRASALAAAAHLAAAAAIPLAGSAYGVTASQLVLAVPLAHDASSSASLDTASDMPIGQDISEVAAEAAAIALSVIDAVAKQAATAVASGLDAAAGILDTVGVPPASPPLPQAARGSNMERPVRKAGNESNLLDVVTTTAELSTLAAAIEQRESLVTALTAKNADLTLLAPTNSAFERVRRPPPDDVVTSVLLYHVVSPATESASLRDGALLVTAYNPERLGGHPQRIRVTTAADRIRLNWHTRIEAPDIRASNGIIHTVDRILVPPPGAITIMAHFPLEFAGFLFALKHANLIDVVKTTSAITVFAPTNAAFKRLGFRRLKYLFSPIGASKLKELLLFHVSPSLLYSPDLLKAEIEVPTLVYKTLKIKPTHDDDEGVDEIEINGESHVVDADGIADNGVIHAIDTVLVPFKWDGLDAEIGALSDEQQRGTAEPGTIFEALLAN
ncbi:hypothetical protein HK105_202294 [Polyrhizophydium stewartii]|uniref:FAS1 domain-containing protein n=1 Tax=Polyrhizophydium stewartii TaxID=2732419 RepID=A0ABR4NFQ7_9FUNG|nr:hypothetical protein HK105_004574 [Polyrhizophydium stewartii]